MEESVIKQEAYNIKKMFLEPLIENHEIQQRQFEEENRSRFDGEYQRDFTRILYASLVLEYK